MQPDEEDLWVLPSWVKPGTSFTRDFGANSPNTARYHILAIVETDMLVLKTWGKRKQRWLYSVECPLFITMHEDKIINIKEGADEA